MKTNCAQFRQSIRPNKIVSHLRTNMKNYAACEYRMDHSLHPRSREHLFQVDNVLLTVPKAVGNLAGNPTWLQLDNMKEVQGSSSAHRKSFDNDDINTWED